MCGLELRQFSSEVQKLDCFDVVCSVLVGGFFFIILCVCVMCTFKDDTNSVCSYVSDV